MVRLVEETDMKQYVISSLVCALLMNIMQLHGQNNQELFLQAGQLYQQGLYPDAHALYAKIDSNGAAVWYNRALTDVQLHHIVDARLCFLRALKYAPTRSVYRQIYAEYKQFIKQSNQDSVIDRMYHMLVALSRGHSLRTLQLLVIMLLFACSMLWYYRRRFWLLLVSLGFIFCSLLCGVAYVDRQERVFVSAQQVQMHAGRNDSFSVVGVLHQHDIAHVERHEGEWLQLVCEGKRGWVRSEDVIII